jgi:outer membrane protein assembly factor BamD (BamD/ComL family)
MMSVAGIFSSSLFNYINSSSQNKTQGTQGTQGTGQFQQEFAQLGQDLQSGNLSTAQADFASLAKLGAQPGATSQSGITQQFNQLSQDLQSGNLAAAQQDYSTIKQDFSSQGSQMHHHHHHQSSEGSGSSQAGGAETSMSSQLLAQMGQALQSGNISAAQQAYSNLAQSFQQFSL